MVVACHVTWGCYGFWLPNDPRGSGSRYVANRDLYRFGPATKVETRRSRAGVAHDVEARRRAKTTLKHEPLRLSGEMAQTVGVAIDGLGLRVYALAVLPDHVHAVLGRTEVRFEQQVRRMKQSATAALRRADLVRADRPVWARRGWFVFLNDDAAVGRAIRYVEANPVQAGLRPQRWSCVTPWQFTV